jgi:hypothetical protein
MDAYQAMMARRAQLDAERQSAIARAAEPFDNEIREIDDAVRVLKKYGGAGHFDSFPTVTTLAHVAARATLKRTLSKREAILQGVLDVLGGGAQMHTEDLLKALAVKGIVVGGADPLSNLSAYLSRARAELSIDNDRRRGWSLKNKTPETASTVSGVSEEPKLL